MAYTPRYPALTQQIGDIQTLVDKAEALYDATCTHRYKKDKDSLRKTLQHIENKKKEFHTLLSQHISSLIQEWCTHNGLQKDKCNPQNVEILQDGTVVYHGDIDLNSFIDDGVERDTQDEIDACNTRYFPHVITDVDGDLSYYYDFLEFPRLRRVQCINALLHNQRDPNTPMQFPALEECKGINIFDIPSEPHRFHEEVDLLVQQDTLLYDNLKIND